MKFTASIFALLACIAFPAFSFAQSPNISDAFFTKDIVSGVLGQTGCTGVRLYPVETDGRLSVMMIGTKSDGTEIYSADNNAAHYQIFSSVSGTSVADAPLIKDVAGAICNAYQASNSEHKFVVNISASKVSKMLGSTSAGVMVHLTTNAVGNLNFALSGYRSADGRLVQEGAAVDGEPCPTMCGDGDNYLSPVN